MSNKFRITSISAANYYTDNDKLSGQVSVIHDGSQMKMDIKLTPDDCTAIFAIVSDRVADHMQEVAIKVAEDLKMDTSRMLEASVARKQAMLEAHKPREVEDAEVIDHDGAQDAPEEKEVDPF